MGEDALIRRLTHALPAGPDVLTGPGDDCAVVRPLRRRGVQLLKTDCIVEGVHFLRKTPPEQVGWKAMARVVSDIAAMGGTPLHALVTLVLPTDLKITYVECLYSGLRRCAGRFGISIVGGETSRGTQIVVSVSLTGSILEKRCIGRSGAKAGDAIYVTGRLGGSLRGRHSSSCRFCRNSMVANISPSAMMDLSDDLPTISGMAGNGPGRAEKHVLGEDARERVPRQTTVQ